MFPLIVHVSPYFHIKSKGRESGVRENDVIAICPYTIDFSLILIQNIRAN